MHSLEWQPGDPDLRNLEQVVSEAKNSSRDHVEVTEMPAINISVVRTRDAKRTRLRTHVRQQDGRF
jgi:hypothetical protein